MWLSLSRRPLPRFSSRLSAPAPAVSPKRHIQLFIAGSTDNRIFGKKVVRRENVLRTGYISDDELRTLHENAAVASNASSLLKSGADTAIFFDPESPEQTADPIASVLTGTALRNDLSKKGKAQAGKFRWRDTARQTWATLQI